MLIKVTHLFSSLIKICHQKIKGFFVFQLSIIFSLGFNHIEAAKETTLSQRISITLDDFNPQKTPLLSWEERNQRLLDTLNSYRIRAGVFVAAQYIDDNNDSQQLKKWDKAQHLIGNHSYSHFYYHQNKITCEDAIKDILRAEKLLNHYKNFHKLFRFPFLKEGNTIEKRDCLRSFFSQNNYHHGYVSIDTSDWYIDQRLKEKLKRYPRTSLAAYRQYYLEHIEKKVQYYHQLALKVTGHSPAHTILLHHNLINALFLGDVLKMLQKKGWQLIDAKQAFQDSIYKKQPMILPAGESIIWALAKENGHYEKILTYPGEDETYDQQIMDKLGL